MNKIMNELNASQEQFYIFKIGKTLASSLIGFVAGFIVGSLVWISYFLPKLPN